MSKTNEDTKNTNDDRPKTTSTYQTLGVQKPKKKKTNK